LHDDNTNPLLARAKSETSLPLVEVIAQIGRCATLGLFAKSWSSET